MANKEYFNFSCLTMVGAVLFIMLKVNGERNVNLGGGVSCLNSISEQNVHYFSRQHAAEDLVDMFYYIKGIYFIFMY